MRYLRPHLRQADLALANLECPLTRRQTPMAKQYAFRCDPEVGGALKSVGFGVVSLANNHSIDQGRDALVDTIQALTGAGVTPVGAGVSDAQARAPRIVAAGPLRLAVLAYYDFPIEGLMPFPDRPAPARLRDETIATEVAAARAQADAVVVTLHWGAEHHTRPTPRQRRLGHLIIDAGAALVVGHHPHVLQPVERYRHGVIAYSLGNLVFDQHRGDRVLTALLRCRVSRRGTEECQPLPLTIRRCTPRPANRSARRRITELLGPGVRGADEPLTRTSPAGR